MDEAFNKLKKNTSSYNKAFTQFVTECEEKQLQNDESQNLFWEVSFDNTAKFPFNDDESDESSLPIENHFLETSFMPQASLDGSKAVETLLDNKLKQCIFKQGGLDRNTEITYDEPPFTESANDCWLISPRYSGNDLPSVRCGVFEKVIGGLISYVSKSRNNYAKGEINICQLIYVSSLYTKTSFPTLAPYLLYIKSS